MIRNWIDYSEYRIQRGNFEFWDKLNNKKATETLEYIWEAFQGKIFLINKALMDSHRFSNTEILIVYLFNL